MAVSQVVDVTADFNDGSEAILDIGGFDFAVVQLVTPSGTVNFLHSNDAGAVTGVSDGSAASAINFVAVTGTVMSTGAGATSLAASNLIKFTGIGRFLQIKGSAVTAVKVLVRLYKSF